MQITPVGDLIMVLPEPMKEKKESSIILPEDLDDEKKPRGEVLGVGTNKIVDVGDIVYFALTAGQDVDVDGVKYRMLRPQDILAKVVKEV